MECSEILITVFLQMDVLPENRKDSGLQSVFKSVYPIKDFTGTASLEFVSYRFAEIKTFGRRVY